MITQKTPLKEIYISLGSNIESRIENLQQACKLISLEIGTISKYSSVFETPAWGFVSTPFYNACIKIETSLTTKECLLKLLQIEKEIGRKKKQGNQYEARPIDLDIIYSTEGIFKLLNLTVPHPLMKDRKFVLVPLQEISNYLKHPLLHKTTDELLKMCPDNSTVKKTDFILKPL